MAEFLRRKTGDHRFESRDRISGDQETSDVSSRTMTRAKFISTLSRGVGGLVLGQSALGFLGKARGCIIPDGADPQLYRNLGASLAGRLVFTQGTNAAGKTFKSSGFLLDSWNVLTAAHSVPAVPGPGTVDFIGTGSNRYTDPGKIIEAESWPSYPTYYGGFSQPDLAIITLRQSANVPTISFAGVSKDQVVLWGGFGYLRTPTTPNQPDDGSSMAWHMPVLPFNPGGQPTQYYFSCDYDDDGSIVLPGRTNGESGGYVGDEHGGVAHGVIVGHYTLSGDVGGSFAVRLDNPEK